MVTILSVGAFSIAAVTAQKIFEAKNRYDLANILELLFKLSLVGLGGYILIDLLSTVFSLFYL